MASPDNAFLCALIATAFWPLLGYALARRLVPRVLALGTASVIGWSTHSAATLPIYLLLGFSPFAVAGIGGVCVLVAGFSLSQPGSASETEPALTIPLWAFAAAAVLALIRRPPSCRKLPAMPSGLPARAVNRAECAGSLRGLKALCSPRASPTIRSSTRRHFETAFCQCLGLALQNSILSFRRSSRS